MQITHSIEARQAQTQRVDPRQILASEILMWTSAELEAAVERELSENPALEVREGEALPDPMIERGETPTAASETLLPVEQQRRTSLVEETASPETPRDPLRELSAPRATGSAADDFDPMDRVANAVTLADHLRTQVGQVTDAEDAAALVRYLIECVDERGYLALEIAEVAEQCQVTCAAVERAISALQRMDPPGVGARDLRECLGLQAEYLLQIGEGDADAARILNDCWDDLATHRMRRIASRLRLSEEQVSDAVSFIQHALTPYPGAAFRPAWSSQSASSPAVRPDVIFQRVDAGFLVEVTRDYEKVLTIAPLWRKLADQGEQERPLRSAVSARASRPENSSSMQRYIRDNVGRADAFLNGVARRGRTLRRIADALIRHQQGYLETGDRAFLRPLTRATLSDELGLDESVISRAVSDKWAQLPAGEVVSLDAFFGNAHAVRDALVQLISEENPSDPYSDDVLAEMLTRQGFPLARRTVAKYRGLEKILPARLRKRV